MPLGDIPAAGEIWAARPKPLSALWGGAKAGAPVGAAAGLWAGGPVGAAVGAAAGTALGVVAQSSRRLSVSMEHLERVTRSLVEQYKAYSPVIARLRHQWILLDRRLNRIWADTIAPTLKKLTEIGTEFRERWTRMKVDFFQAIEPALKRILDVFQKLGRATLWVFEKLLKVINEVINRLTKLLPWLKPEERERRITGALGPYEMEWPTTEGPLTGAMRRAGLTGPPFTGEEARRPAEGEEKEATGESYLKQLWQQPLRPLIDLLNLGRDAMGPKTGEEPGVNVNVNVSDSKELSAAFERVWHEATYELRKIEAEDMYMAYLLQEEGTYV